jgi:predicted anti-sigma-YlaC factor YlaD
LRTLREIGNQAPACDDWSDMNCREIREACSAALDGEDPGVSRAVIDEHLRTCDSCREFVARAEMPDLTPRIAMAAEEDRALRSFLSSPVRVALVGIAVAQLAMAVPTLLFGTDEGAPIHVAHEVGAWDLALAVGFLFAAWRPLRAVGMLPFVAALSAGLVLTAVIDIANGKTPAVLELTHVLELVGTVLLWMLTSPRPRRVLKIV